MTLPRQCNSPRPGVRFALIFGLKSSLPRFIERRRPPSCGQAAVVSLLIFRRADTRPRNPGPIYAICARHRKAQRGPDPDSQWATASRVSADAELDQGRLRLTNLQGEILGGHHRGEWTADFTANPPTYIGSGTLEQVALGQIADTMHDDWITGTASVGYNVKMLGWSKPELLAGAVATFSFQIEVQRDGSLPRLVLTAEGSPLHSEPVCRAFASA